MQRSKTDCAIARPRRYRRRNRFERLIPKWDCRLFKTGQNSALQRRIRAMGGSEVSACPTCRAGESAHSCYRTWGCCWGRDRAAGTMPGTPGAWRLATTRLFNLYFLRLRRLFVGMAVAGAMIVYHKCCWPHPLQTRRSYWTINAEYNYWKCLGNHRDNSIGF